jgi:hypothetical protein
VPIVTIVRLRLLIGMPARKLLPVPGLLLTVLALAGSTGAASSATAPRAAERRSPTCTTSAGKVTRALLADARALPPDVIGALRSPVPDVGVYRSYCHDLLGGPKPELLTNVGLGGSIGGIAWIVLRPSGARWTVVHIGRGQPSGFGMPRHVSASPAAVRREIVESQPVYLKGDPNCCPSGSVTRTFRWNGRTFAPVPATHAASWPLFMTPSGNIACSLAGSPAELRCDIGSGLRPTPPHPGWCITDWGHGLELPAGDRPHVLCAGDVNPANLPDRTVHVLLYGRTWSSGQITCASRTSGLRCVNRIGHGFFLSRERWSVF